MFHCFLGSNGIQNGAVLSILQIKNARYQPLETSVEKVSTIGSVKDSLINTQHRYTRVCNPKIE
jgi:hypothetical protein